MSSIGGGNAWRCGILSFALAVPMIGCAPTVDYENVDGVGFSDDEFFRFVDYPETTQTEAFDVLERLIRMHFAGARVYVDRATFTIETEPQPFSNSAQRITLYGQVSTVETSARVELFARREAMRRNLTSAPSSPWEYVGADAQVENLVFQELWDALVVSKRIDGEPTPQQPAPERSPTAPAAEG